MKHGQMALVALAVLTTMVTGAVQARTVSVPTYVCNPGATVRVPVMIDDASGCACVDVRLTYDAQVLVPVKVEAGSLSRSFGEDLILGDETPGLVAAALFASGDVAAANGTVAVVTFRVREGTAGLFSDLTVSEVTLGTANGLNAETRENPTHVVHGMVRVVGADADVARLERAQVVCAGTSVGSLTLAAGDGIAAGNGPVSVAGEVTAEGPIPVTAPAGGWSSATYRLLTTRAAGLTLALQGLGEEDELTPGVVVEEDGRVTYTATLAVARPQPVDPEESQAFADAAKAQAMADAINADKETMIRTPQGAVAKDYTSLFAAVAIGNEVMVALNETGTNTLAASAEKVVEQVEGLGDSAAAEVTIAPDKADVVPGFYYGLGASTEAGGAKVVTEWQQATTEGLAKPLTAAKPSNEKGFFRVRVSVKPQMPGGVDFTITTTD